MEKRIPWIDFCKGIGIYLVVFGHFLPTGTPLKVIIYSFHVPLFFILSGYLLKEDRKWTTQIFHRMRVLLIPYFGFATVSLIYYFFFSIDILEMAKRFFYLNGQTIWNDPLWFLFTLFIVEFLAYTLLYSFPLFQKNNRALLCLIIITMAVGCFVYYFNPDFLTFLGLNKAVCLLGFYLLGYFFRQTKLVDSFAKPKEVWLGVFLLICVIALALNWNNNISVYYFDLNNYFVFLLTSIIGSFSVIQLCRNVDDFRFVISVSRHTIFILGTHYIFMVLYTQISNKIPIDSMLYSLPVW